MASFKHKYNAYMSSIIPRKMYCLLVSEISFIDGIDSYYSFLTQISIMCVGEGKWGELKVLIIVSIRNSYMTSSMYHHINIT